MKKFIISIIFSFFITSEVLARSTGCKEGNCENGYGKWVYTDKKLMKVNGLIQKKMVKEKKLGLMDIFTKANLRIASGVGKVL